MSYEGYSQLLCKNGHTWNIDCNELSYLYPSDYPKCPFCKEKPIWENIVNTTNGSFDEKDRRIDGFVKLKVKKEISGVCSNCGKKHICEITYKIPKRKGVKLK